MRHTMTLYAALILLLSLPAWSAKLVEAPPPPPMPEGLPDEYETQAKPAEPETIKLGQALYESNCTSCHDSVIRISSSRTLNSLQELREQVGRRAAAARLQWSKEEIEAVVRHLDGRHYRFTP